MRYNPTMNAKVVLPLDEMTFSEKVEVMDAVWDDIRRHPEDIEWPAWHETYLRELEEEIANGTAKFVDLETAEKILMEQTP